MREQGIRGRTTARESPYSHACVRTSEILKACALKQDERSKDVLAESRPADACGKENSTNNRQRFGISGSIVSSYEYARWVSTCDFIGENVCAAPAFEDSLQPRREARTEEILKALRQQSKTIRKETYNNRYHCVPTDFVAHPLAQAILDRGKKPEEIKDLALSCGIDHVSMLIDEHSGQTLLDWAVEHCDEHRAGEIGRVLIDLEAVAPSVINLSKMLLLCIERGQYKLARMIGEFAVQRGKRRLYDGFKTLNFALSHVVNHPVTQFAGEWATRHIRQCFP